MAAKDVPEVVAYWCGASPAELARMAVDPRKLPAEETLRAQLDSLLATPEAKARSFYSVWLVDGRPVGYSSLKNIVRDDHADMHLHIWDPTVRGKGFGATLFCLSALDFFERFQLRRIVCEPSVGNPMANAMLRRVGFRLLGSRVGASSELSAVTDLNAYAIERDVAQAYLQRAVAPTKAAGE